MSGVQPPLGEVLRAAMPDGAPASGARERIRARVQAEVDTKRRHRERRRLLAIGLVVPAAIAALVMTLAPEKVVTRPATPRPDVPPQEQAATPRPAQTVVLAAGARVWIDRGSQLTVERDEPAAGALRLERGAVVVDVDRRAGRTFAVDAGDVRVDVVGTLFAVQRNDDGGVAVRVARGQVNVTRGAVTAVVSAGHSWPPGVAAPEIDAGVIERLRSDEPPAPPPVNPVPAPATTPRDDGAASYRRAQRLERRGDIAEALLAYQAIGAGRNRHRQDALYAVGRLRLARGDAEGALAAFNLYRTRHPAGAYARAIDVHVFDLLIAQGQRGPALAEADRFIAEHASDSRARRFRLARAALNADQGRCAAALADLQQLGDGARGDVVTAVQRRCGSASPAAQRGQ